MTLASFDATATHSLAVDGGRIAYRLFGSGPLLVLAPGMGELQSTYRHLVPLLVDAGYLVATTDLRGHGESDASFERFGDEETAADLGALIRAQGGAAATVIGNSLSAAAAVILAAREPGLVSRLVLIGPFVRPPQAGAAKTLLFRLLMAGPWATAVWKAYLPTLYAGRTPADLPEYLRTVAAALARPGFGRAFRQTTRADHAVAEKSLAAVRAPALIVMGDRDPDFPSPAAEASWVAESLQGSAVLIPDAGHYPHAQQPEHTAEAIIAFLDTGADRG